MGDRLGDAAPRLQEVRGGATAAGRMTVVYASAFSLAVLVSHAELAVAALAIFVATALTLSGLRWSLGWRVAPVAAIMVGAVAPASLLPWAIAAACAWLALASTAAADSTPRPSLGSSELHLARCRRRGEPATVLCIDADPDALQRLYGVSRVTDSLAIRRTGSRRELYGVLEGRDLQRETIERRFVEASGGASLAFAWAVFPDDGMSIDVLLRCARSRLASETDSTASTEPARRGTGERARGEPQLQSALGTAFAEAEVA